MKLYGRTLLFFLGAITFQALLTAGLIVGLVSRNNQTVTRGELHEESAAVYDNYNSWVRALWKNVIEIRDDTVLSDLADSIEDWTDEDRLIDRLESSLRDSGIDSIVIRRKGWDHFTILSDAYPYIDDFQPFEMDRDHPYIALKNVEGHTFLVASTRLGSDTGIYLLKHIDDDFYNQLKTRDHTRIFVSSDGIAIWQAIGSGEDFSESLNLGRTYPPYREIYNQNFGRGHYNVSTRNLGHLEGRGELKLLVFMSVEPYYNLLFRIGRIVLLVSLLTAVLTSGIALLFSKRLSRPVQNLARATRHVQEGNLDIAVHGNTSGEIRELVQDFNRMIHHLRENRKTLDENIKEITFLKDYNETIIHSLRAGIIVVDDNLVIEKSNGFFRECFSNNGEIPEGRNLRDTGNALLDSEILQSAAEIAGGSLTGWVGIRRDGNNVWEVKLYPLEGSGSQGKCVIELDDVSARTDLEQKILQAEKLSSLSLLSAGIAHEINNPLSTILSNAQMLMTQKEMAAGRESLEWIEKETRRIADIVQNLRNFSLADENSEDYCDMNECIEEVVRLVQYSVGSNAEVQINLNSADQSLETSIPSDELRQTVMNILQNAVQAVNGSGRISIDTFNRDSRHHGITISDTGCGIPEEIRGRIFDPFFTTKKGVEGTGLGLSIVYGIVKKFGGDIELISEEGKGSTFTLILPGREAQ